MTTTEDQNNQRNNQFGALVSDSDSEDSSATQRRHSVYWQEVTTDQQQLQVTKEQIEDNDWKVDVINNTMKVTVEALEALCAESIIPLHEYGTVKL